jgi:hypothetical protein
MVDGARGREDGFAEAVDGQVYPSDLVAVDADRTPGDPELVAGDYTPDPWETEPERWEGTEPVPAPADQTPLPLPLPLPAGWVLIPSLVALRETFNRAAPRRDKASDGSIGDAAHAGSSSDHNPDETGTVPIRDADSVNEVHAIDVDENLRATDTRGSFTMLRAVRQLVADHRSGAENRLRYIIYERTIWSDSWNWSARNYTGANPHDHHAHFSGSYDTARERNTRPWNIGFVEVDDVSKAEVKDALDDPVPWVSSGVRNLARSKGWGDSISTRALLEYVFAAVALTAPESDARLLAAVLNVDEEVLAKLVAEETPVEVTADALRRLLGERATAVGEVLAKQS